MSKAGKLINFYELLFPSDILGNILLAWTSELMQKAHITQNDADIFKNSAWDVQSTKWRKLKVAVGTCGSPFLRKSSSRDKFIAF